MSATAAPQNILIVRPSALGDVARTVPALVSCQTQWPQAQIDWLVNDAFVGAIAHHPDLNEAIPFPRKKFKRFGISPTVTWKVLKYLGQLRRRRYDLVIDLQGLSRSGWIARSSGAARRVGPADAREMGWLGYTQRVLVNPQTHHTVDRMLEVIAGTGAAPVHDMRLYTSQPDRAWAEQKCGNPAGRMAVVAPGALWQSKRWPADRYAQLIERLGTEGFDTCIIVGTDADRANSNALLEPIGQMRVVDLLGQTTVGQLMAVIEKADLVLANDSAALHLAIGLGRRCLGLFGPTDPKKVGPYRYPIGTLACPNPGPAHYRHIKTDQSLMRQIEVDTAWDVVQRVLQSEPPKTVF